ncbi:MAG TPA: N,N-dimethylformamidase beta subunit family domain-containing protein [Candidatus Binatia bacterium]|nr:N,N-dimethylformamidase beta subunit family domain-containing protein [Candidatus Binatia bacterium]
MSPPGTFRVEVLQRGLAPDKRVLSDDNNGKGYPAGDNGIPPDASINGCNWPPAYQLQVGADWVSGVYLARLTTANGDSTDVLFVIKAAALGSNSKILFQLAVNTAQAYNNWGGKSLYPYNSSGYDPADPSGNNRARQVSFDRPGIEGHVSDEGGSDSPFASYEYNFVQWLEMNGFEVEYCTSIDLHSDPHFLDNYQLLLSVGHDEYWSNNMRNNVERFIANGGNFAIFGGNICWWQVRFSDDLRTMICYRIKAEDIGTANDLVTVNWWADPVFRPGNTMTGVDSRQGAYWANGNRAGLAYKVQFLQHWVFYSALDGDHFGADQVVIGYEETDAADLTNHGNGAVPRATGADGTPLNFVCLAIADGQDWAVRSGGSSGWATMGIFHNNGTVFTAATTNWSLYLSLNGGWTSFDQITQNILRRLSCPCTFAAELVNAGFEQYDADGVPSGWQLEGAGSVSPGDVNIGHTPLEVDAVRGETWISQGPFPLESQNYYSAGCWARADQPGATIRLQSMASWIDFAIAVHPGDGLWHYLYAVGVPDAGEDPVFPARVKIQVAQGIARFDSVRVEAIAPPP